MSGPIGSSQWMYAIDDGYIINQSLRFEDGDKAHMSTSFTDAGTSTAIGTFSWWMKRGNLGISKQDIYFVNGGAGGIQIRTDKLAVNSFDSNNTQVIVQTNAVLRDPSAFYHCVVATNGTNGTIKFYINGVEQAQTVSSGSLVAGRSWDFLGHDSRVDFLIGGTASANNWDGLLAEYHYIDGQELDPTSFGETIGGAWVPKEYSGSYGDNGFYLTFEGDGTAQTTAGTTAQVNIGDDQSGNGNNWAVNNLVASDVVLDSPTNNFSTMNPLNKASSNVTLKEGNLATATLNSSSSAANTIVTATMALPLSGKWYWEADFTGQATGGSQVAMAGVLDSTFKIPGQSNNFINSSGDYITWYGHNNSMRNGSQNVSYTSEITTQATGTVSFAVDMDNLWVWVAVNGTWINGTPDFSDGTNKVYDLTSGVNYLPFYGNNGGSSVGFTSFNFGQGGKTFTSEQQPDDGVGTFEYDVPAGYKALCTLSFPEPAIGPNSSTQADDYFNTVLYTGDGTSSNAITGVGFQPDFLWIKQRSAIRGHQNMDSVRGASVRLQSHGGGVETASGLVSFDSDGFTVDGTTLNGTNADTGTFVAWSWKAGGTAVLNEEGTIDSQVSAAPDAGFSIVSYTGVTGDDTVRTIGHGLNSAPELIIVKNRDWGSGGDGGWEVGLPFLSTPQGVLLDSSAAASTTQWDRFFNTAPTVDVFSTYSASAYSTDVRYRTNGRADNYIAYCFHSVPGYSRVSTYEGNGNANGTFVYTGFRPAWVMVKEIDASGFWMIQDNKVYPFNDGDTRSLAANDTGTETTISNRGNEMDILSNGFKMRASTGDFNASGNTHIYLAFAETPFKHSVAR